LVGGVGGTWKTTIPPYSTSVLHSVFGPNSQMSRSKKGCVAQSEEGTLGTAEGWAHDFPRSQHCGAFCVRLPWGE